jgi:hypothetical protein
VVLSWDFASSNKNKGGYREMTLISLHGHSVSKPRAKRHDTTLPLGFRALSHADFRTAIGNSSNSPDSFGGNHFETLRKRCGT